LIVMATPPFEQCKRAGIPSGALTSKRSRRAGALDGRLRARRTTVPMFCRDASSCPRRPCRCAPPPPTVVAQGIAAALLEAMRPKQWLKNVFVLGWAAVAASIVYAR